MRAIPCIDSPKLVWTEQEHDRQPQEGDEAEQALGLVVVTGPRTLSAMQMYKEEPSTATLCSVQSSGVGTESAPSTLAPGTSPTKAVRHAIGLPRLILLAQ